MQVLKNKSRKYFTGLRNEIVNRRTITVVGTSTQISEAMTFETGAALLANQINERFKMSFKACDLAK